MGDLLHLLRTAYLLQSYGTPKCKPGWLSEPGDTGTHPLGSRHKRCDTDTGDLKWAGGIRQGRCPPVSLVSKEDYG